jgi:predicted TPR repeat methyltransferase
LFLGKSVLELGCGEGHLTQAIFNGAKTVTGIDLSDVAIERAKERKISNAQFENTDFLRVSFEGFDVVAAIECLYYLSPEEQETFFAKVASEHAGKILILPAPIIGENENRKYYTHQDMLVMFARHGMRMLEFHNINVWRKAPRVPRAAGNLVAALVKMPFGSFLLDLAPEALIYQRCYIIRMM